MPHHMLVSQAGAWRQRVVREALGAGALAAARDSVPGDPARTGGAEPQATSTTPCRPVGTRCWCEPSARITNRSAQQKSGCRRLLEKAIRPPPGEYAGPKLMVGHLVVASLVRPVPSARMT